MLSVAVAPLVVCAAVAGMVAVVQADEAWLLGVGLVVPAYFTLFAFVFPMHWLLQRIGVKGMLSFCAACGGGILLPWFALYWIFFGAGPGKYAGASGQVLCMLMVPTLVAVIVAALVYWLFGESRESVRG